jgi:glycosyltransferase involved in cell wall biosynthesis
MITNKYTVLHTEWSDGWGGQEKRILSEMAGMQARGHTILLATRAHATIAEKAREAGIPVHILPFRNNLDVYTIYKLYQLIAQYQVQIVATHSGKDNWCGGLAAKLAGVKLVRTRHLAAPLKRNWRHFIHYLADRIVTCGERVREMLIQQYRFPATQLVSIPTGIDFTHFVSTDTRDNLRLKWQIGADEWIIVMVGVIRSVKRHEIALRAFAKVAQVWPKARLFLLGDGPLRQNMEALAQALNLQAHVQFFGHREDIPDFLALADCALLTSRSEGLPQALSQASGMGLPIVATNVGSVSEVVLEGQTGLLSKAEDIEAIAANILRLAKNPGWANEMGLQGKSHVLAHLSLHTMLDKTEQLYNSLAIYPGPAKQTEQ